MAHWNAAMFLMVTTAITDGDDDADAMGVPGTLYRTQRRTGEVTI